MSIPSWHSFPSSLAFFANLLFKRIPHDFPVILTASCGLLSCCFLHLIDIKAILAESRSMFLPRLTPSKLLVPSIVVITVIASVQLTQAKSIRSLGYSNLRASDAIKMRRGGCAAFGHSCFGGHGKRSESAGETEGAAGGLQPPSEDLKVLIVSEGEKVPVDVFGREQPDSELNYVLPGQYQSEDYVRFSPLFRKWLANSYRRGDLVAGN